MKCRTIEVRDIHEHPGGQTFATGTVECLVAAPGTTGPNHVPVARYTGPLVLSYRRGERQWYPLGCRGDYPERWTNI